MTKPGVVEDAGGKAPEAILDDATPAPAKRWRVGTLSYTQAQLVNVFFWLLWGDFCLNVMESIIPRLVPLELDKLGASNALIGILTGSIFSAMNWVMNPVISTWSDRHRGPRGRRMPFMLWPTPPLAAALIFVGFAGNVAAFVGSHWPGAAGGLSRFFASVLPDLTGLTPAAQLTIGMIGVALVLYKFFDLFPQCVYYYVWADVVPQEVMGKFTCLFRVFASGGGFAFHYWILGYADTHPGAVYVGCALLYMVAFLLLSLLVKEGEYPPPPVKVRRTDKVMEELARWRGEGWGLRWRAMRGAVGLLAWVERMAGEPGSGGARHAVLGPVARGVATGVFVLKWALECFGTLYYWKYYGVYACFRWAFVPFNAMLVVYARDGVGMNMEDFGHKMAWAMAVQMPIFFLLGPAVDRFHPVRVSAIGFVAMAASGVLGFFFTTGPGTFFVWAMTAFGAIALFQGGLVSLGPRLLPRTRYGQFCAATMMVVESGVIVLSWVCGKMMDVLGEEYLWLWLTAFAGLGVVAVALLYWGWRKEGGDRAYLAPGGYDDATACVVKASQ